LALVENNTFVVIPPAIGSLSINISTTSNCLAFPGSVKLFGFDALNNSVAEIPSESNYAYSICVSHDIYSLGNSCAGNFQRLFYL